MNEDGESWTPVGHNDAITWPSLSGVLHRRDLASVDAYLGSLTSYGVTCIRLMLEYAESKEGHFESPAGHFLPEMVQVWDDIFDLCRRHGLRILLTPFDTFWTWLKWSEHPYSIENGGFLASPSRVLLCEETRNCIKARLEFASRRWGGSGTLFAWDLWNEIHPAQAEESAEGFSSFISDVSAHMRKLENELYGRHHLQTVSLFGPELVWRPDLDLATPTFRHPDLDFATIHIYREGTIDDPQDTVAPALDMAAIVADSLRQIKDDRPFLDTEHGPIHSFKDHHVTLPAKFDDEYFRHMQWAHLAAGGAGGGMRWPNRIPHVLTPGMHEAQRAMAEFLPLIDWVNFRRRNCTDEVRLSTDRARAVACADNKQAVLWLVRTDALTKEGLMRRRAKPLAVSVTVPGLAPGFYQIIFWDTRAGAILATRTLALRSGEMQIPFDLATDVAIAIQCKVADPAEH